VIPSLVTNIAVISYSLTAVFFLGLSVVLLTSWRGRLQGALLVLASLMTVLWAVAAAYLAAAGGALALNLLQLSEILRDAAWFGFILKLFSPAMGQGAGAARKRRLFHRGIFGFCAVLLVYPYLKGLLPKLPLTLDLYLLGFVLLAIIGLTLVEQLFRNTRIEERWSIKFLCLGLGGMFAYDFFLYSEALLFKHINADLWGARGMINALVAPLIAVSAARNPEWSLDVFVSRRVVFHSAALLGAGVYLLAMAAGGYYIRIYGGSWGGIAQVTFLFGAAIILLLLMFSGTLRAKLKVFLNKHFYSYKYDYRDEWLKFIGTLSSGVADEHLRERAIKGLAEIMDCPAGMLWMAGESGDFEPVAHWNMSDPVDEKERADGSLARFMQERQWVINLDEYDSEPEFYEGLELPEWLIRLSKTAWLVVPLIHHDALLGFVALARPRTTRSFNWEDSDLLKTAGRQAASYLALWETTQALVDARQFEAFNRLSAYVVHDLKNLAAQLALVVSNAEKHINNPEFMKDAIGTVDNAVAKMNRMLAHLRNKGTRSQSSSEAVELVKLLCEVNQARGLCQPIPKLKCEKHGMYVTADRDRLGAVVEHIIQNAQEATPSDGKVQVRLKQEGAYAVIEVEDNGCGMDAEFVRERLFRPFDTTKGNAGMGIGAYESREFVHSLGGQVDVRSRLGEGALFRIALPLLQRSGMSENGEQRTEVAI